ncbi:META domain-containing protein [Flavobacterium buctense]|uniref:META domain-containing protein n=1 Tax=Flavobacterium buctense TaxID=1648146 RepID=A0ABU9E2F6_9FLAO|nr:META domain-containing protein [Flavobacterium buctense]
MNTLKKISLIIITLIMSMGCSTPKNIPANNESEVNYPLTETYWKLIELNGQPVTAVENRREAFLILKKDNNRVNGNSGCNNLNGYYQLTGQTELTFSKMATTMMACKDMTIEKAFLETLQRVDNYAIKGKVLSLSKAKMAPMAKFEVVFMK